MKVVEMGTWSYCKGDPEKQKNLYANLGAMEA